MQLGKVRLLDFGCGASHLYKYIRRHKFDNIRYNGLDISEEFLSLSRSKLPSIPYYQLDILDEHVDPPIFDYIVMNDIFNSKFDLSFEEMFAHFQVLVERVFNHPSIGTAFNNISKQVDWKRDNLF